MVFRIPAAEQDLVDHFVAIGQEDPVAADRFLDQAEALANRLVAFPRSGRAWPTADPRLAGLRVVPVPRFPNYLVFYRHDSRGVILVRVLHGARQIERVLDDP